MSKSTLSKKDLNYLASVGTDGESAEDFASKIEKVIKNIFPDSFVYVKFNEDRTEKSIFVNFALGKDKSEWDNGIIQNDPLWHQIWIWGIDSEGNMMDKIKMDAHVGGRLVLRENDETGYRSKIVKIGFRNMTGTSDKIFKGINNYFKKAKSMIKEYKDRLRSNSPALKKI